MDDVVRAQLMRVVEGIVRPVRAWEWRKMRMRRELLAHAQAAMEEEQRAGVAEKEAIERAGARLGAADDLTRQLQISVPRAERVLMAKLRVGKWMDDMELVTGRAYGMHRQALVHGSILVATSGIVGIVALLVSVPIAQRWVWSENDMAYAPLFLLGSVLIAYLLFAAARGMVETAAKRGERASLVRRVGAGIGIVLGLQMMWTFLVAATALGRAATIGEVGCGLAATTGIAAVAVVMARFVGRWRREHEEWAAIEIAG